MQARIEASTVALFPILVGLLGAGCSALPQLFGANEDPYVISRIHRPARTTSSLPDWDAPLEAKEDPAPILESPVAGKPDTAVTKPVAAVPEETPEPMADADPKGEAAEPEPETVAAREEDAPDESIEVAQDAEVAPDDPGAAQDAQDASIARARNRQPRIVRGDRVTGAPIEDPARDFSGTVRDLLLDPSTGEAVGIVAASFQDAGGEDARVYDFDSLRWSIGSLGASLSVAGPQAGRPAATDDYSGLFNGHEIASVRGTVTEFGPADRESAGAVLTLRDEENRFHRVLLGAAEFLTRTVPGVAVGNAIGVDGVLTRDDGGKLWVATAVTAGDRTVRVRDESGRVLWRELTARFASDQNVPASIRSSDGVVVPVHGWVLDVDSGTTASLCVVVDGALRLLPRENVQRGPDAWTTDLDAAALTRLRRPPVGRSTEADPTRGGS